MPLYHEVVFRFDMRLGSVFISGYTAYLWGVTVPTSTASTDC